MARRRQTEERKRIPVGDKRNVLTVEGKDPNYVYRWVNDTDNRINEFKAAGYEFETNDVEVGTEDVKQASQVGKTVSKNVGQGITSYLMKQKKEWYAEDQEAYNKNVDRSEDIIYDNVNKLSERYGEIKIK